MTTWGMRRTIGAIAVAAAVAGVGGAAIAAATEGGHSVIEGGLRGPGGPPPPARPISAGPDSLHGEYVVADGHGGYPTRLSQTGRVTAISATSVTARSVDGFVQTYAVHEARDLAVPPFAIGDEVSIEATREGEAAVVTTIRPPLSPSGS